MSARDELASFFFWLADRLERRHAAAVVRYNTKMWPHSHTGKSAVTTKPASTYFDIVRTMSTDPEIRKAIDETEREGVA